MSIDNTNGNTLGRALRDKRHNTSSPITESIKSGIYRAITTGQPDPEGRGRVAAYVPKLGGEPDYPIFFQYASPFGGQNGQGSYGMFAVPPDAGVTILVFFADGGELSEGYWFASTQETHDVVAGGTSGQAEADGTGQGEGAFVNVPAAKANPTELSTLQGTNPSSRLDGKDGLSGNTSVAPEVTPSDAGLTPDYGDLYSESRISQNERSEDTSEVKEKNAERIPTNVVRSSDGTPVRSETGGFVCNGECVFDDEVEDANEKEDDLQNEVEEGNEEQENTQTTSTHPNSSRNANVAAQGVYSDSVRGQSTANPRRDANYENPQHSKVYGIKTPGANALTIDDGSVDDDGTVHPNQIRLQTGSGASIVLDGTNDMIYMINSTGSGWVEIGASGEIMAYAQGSISMRAEKDFNLRADRNINMEAGSNIHVKAGNHYHLNAGNQAHIKSGGSQFYDSGGANHTKVATNMYASTGGDIHLNGPQASMSPGIPTTSHPDIQSLASTQVDDSIVATMPSHEPMMRPKPSPTQSGGTPNSPANTPVADPTTASGASEAAGNEGPPPEISDAEGLATIRSRNGVTTQVAAVFQKNFQGFIDDLEASGYEVTMLGGYCNRNARGSTRPSYHAMGAAIDVNWNQNGYGSRPSGWGDHATGINQGRGYKCDLPNNVGAIAARHGLGWGGNWSNPWDPMHFSAGSGERGAYQFPRSYKIVTSADITGTRTVRQWTG